MTFAVKLTDWPKVAGLSDEVRSVAVVAFATVAVEPLLAPAV